MLLCTKFGLGVRDRAWFEHRLTVVGAITIPSILSQSDQTLHWVWFVDGDLTAEIREKLEEMLSPFSGRAFLDSGRHAQTRLLQLAQDRDLVDRSGRVLTARIDDDDAWNIDTVRHVRRKVTNWKHRGTGAKGLGITFDHGLEWVMYDMLDIDRLQQKGRRVVHPAAIRNYTYRFHSMSVHVYAPVADGITAMKGSHSRMSETLSQCGYAVDIVSTDQPMWLYCRHKQIDSSVKKARGRVEDLTLRDLAERFGIDEGRTAAYLKGASNYGYATLKRPPAEFGRINRKIAEVRRRRKIASGNDATRLKEEEQRLRDQLFRLSESIVGEPCDADDLVERDPAG